jgi:hypothetical protein
MFAATVQLAHAIDSGDVRIGFHLRAQSTTQWPTAVPASACSTTGSVRSDGMK